MILHFFATPMQHLSLKTVLETVLNKKKVSGYSFRETHMMNVPRVGRKVLNFLRLRIFFVTCIENKKVYESWALSDMLCSDLPFRITFITSSYFVQIPLHISRNLIVHSSKYHSNKLITFRIVFFIFSEIISLVKIEKCAKQKFSISK